MDGPTKSSRSFWSPAALAVIVLACPFGASAAMLSVQAKSYIASVNLLDPSQFDPDAKSCQQAMAAVVDCATLNENPVDGTQGSKEYRLWSQLVVDVTCSGEKVASWQLHPVQQDFGSEIVIFATAGDLSKPLKVQPSQSGKSPTDKVSFSYRLRGRPNDAAVAVMNLVKPRTCSYIWHEVAGTLACRQNQPQIAATITGSKFPSHRLWVGNMKVKDVAQGPFKNLWRCDPTDPSSVQ
jgi:hypothetical protein